jgi:hypothetical protein
MHNPFRERIKRETYNAIVGCYETRHRDLFRPDGSQGRGNAWAGWFWRGYNGVEPNWDRASKDSPGYACWCAGRDIRKREGK